MKSSFTLFLSSHFIVFILSPSIPSSLSHYQLLPFFLFSDFFPPPLNSTPLHFLPILSIQHSHPFNSSYSINSHIQQKNLFVPIHRWQQLNTYPVWRYLSPTGLLWITRHPQLTGGPSPLELFVCMCMNVCMWVHACMCIFVWVCVCLHSCLCVISGQRRIRWFVIRKRKRNMLRAQSYSWCFLRS